MSGASVTPEMIEAFGMAFWQVNAASKIDGNREEIHLALASALCAMPSQEPVAWRYRRQEWGVEYWHYFTKEPRFMEEGEVWEALYASPTPLPLPSVQEPS